MKAAEGGLLNMILLSSNVMRAVLFDLDGTLLDRLPSLRAFVPEQFLRYAPPERHNEIDRYVRRFLKLDANGYGRKETLYETLRSEFNLRAGVSELVEDFRAHAYREAFLYPDTREVLTELKQRGYLLGIVSNGSAQAQRAKITATDLERLVDIVLISGVVGLRKPDPAIFRQAADELGLMPEACLFVGDSPERDMLGAAAAGMRTSWLTHGRSWPSALRPEPSMSLQGLGELLRGRF